MCGCCRILVATEDHLAGQVKTQITSTTPDYVISNDYAEWNDAPAYPQSLSCK